MVFNIPPEAFVCAKTATYLPYGGSALNMLKLIINQTMHTFNAKTDGAFYLRMEGDADYGLWLVAPDNSLNFTSMASMAVHDALEYAATYCDNHDIPGWEDFADWLSGNSGMAEVVFDSVTSITMAGYTTQNVPTWVDPHGNISVFFRWCKAALVAIEQAEGITAQMSSFQSSSTKFVIPMTFTVEAVGGTETVDMDLILQI